ncbi:hypothetical protein Q0F99_07520 [Rathayibacter oskolensis]|nr:hypothetical protein [Rathayibacter oskolensis]WKK72750.1 hypothetical protein Q0F99_07520 [Rathayibacter oskolensis]
MGERTKTRASARTPGTGYGRISTETIRTMVDARRSGAPSGSNSH